MYKEYIFELQYQSRQGRMSQKQDELNWIKATVIGLLVDDKLNRHVHMILLGMDLEEFGVTIV